MCCKGKVEPEKMPPTERAAFLHGLRVHLQIVNWKMLEDDEVCIVFGNSSQVTGIYGRNQHKLNVLNCNTYFL